MKNLLCARLIDAGVNARDTEAMVDCVDHLIACGLPEDRALGWLELCLQHACAKHTGQPMQRAALAPTCTPAKRRVHYAAPEWNRNRARHAIVIPSGGLFDILSRQEQKALRNMPPFVRASILRELHIPGLTLR